MFSDSEEIFYHIIYTVNPLIFAAIKFRVLPMECHLVPINFHVYLACLISCNGSIEFLR